LRKLMERTQYNERCRLGLINGRDLLETFHASELHSCDSWMTMH